MIENLRGFWRRFSKNRAGTVGLVIVLAFFGAALFASYLAPYDPIKIDLSSALMPPGRGHLLGTDELGRDILSRILVGSRISLAVAVSSVLCSLVIGGGLGMVAAFYGGKADSIIMRFIDILLAMPDLLLAITVISILGVGISNLIVAISIASIPQFTRLARAVTLATKSQVFIEAARAMGASDARIVLKHLLPNMMPPMIVQATLRTAYAILNASGLSFLGLGAQPPTPEWGAMLSSARSYISSSPHMVVAPGVAILLVVLGFNLMGDGLRDALDPRLKM